MCLAVPGRLLDVTGDDLARTGRVSFGGIVRSVSLACMPEAEPGQYLLVHAGLAIGSIDADEAERVFRYLEELGELDG